MEVSLTPDQQSRLAQFASRTGKDAEQVVREAVDQMLATEPDDYLRFAEAVGKGFASLDRGEYIEHAEVGARIQQLLNRR